MTSKNYDAAANAAEWDARYSEADRMWSGNPNGVIVDKATVLAPGTALDVGCGEGADALWLADNGWDVTAFDPSQVAIERASLHDDRSRIIWLVTDIQGANFNGRTFDLVNVMYLAVDRTEDDSVERRLLGFVAPGGHLLFVHHVVDADHAHDHPHFAHMITPDHMHELVAGMPDQWEVVSFEDRERHVHSGRGAGHTMDRVLLARRIS